MDMPKKKKKKNSFNLREVFEQICIAELLAVGMGFIGGIIVIIFGDGLAQHFAFAGLQGAMALALILTYLGIAIGSVMGVFLMKQSEESSLLVTSIFAVMGALVSLLLLQILGIGPALYFSVLPPIAATIGFHLSIKK